ncbi:hypothetical protein EGJ48_17955 [Pantoea dispersa]|uniref:hypothetical protein n=1 Tax=Pantoea dispersa TaxID=59814 RepID=UPI000F6785DB|nr:hypothetical protein [Pantoea dispersa]RRW69205.1 hypothetical protein EGJ48_17955 [Pantoea dispersa]
MEQQRRAGQTGAGGTRNGQPREARSKSPESLTGIIGIRKGIIALKTFLFSLLRMMPEDISLDVVKNLSGNGDNPPLNRLCTEMVDSMIATSTRVQEH